MSMLKVRYRQLSQIDQFSAYMRRLSNLVNSETSSAYRHNKSHQNLQQKCGTWGNLLGTQSFDLLLRNE
jgi:hypothetical protein